MDGGDSEYNSILEPCIVISDDDDDDEDRLKIDESMIGPEVSLIPIKKKKQIDFISQSKRQNYDELDSVSLIVTDKRERRHSITRETKPLEKCPICKQYFRRIKTHLQKHTELAEVAGNVLPCQFCSRVFTSASTLSIHMRTHTGDKPYVCSVCNKGFTQSCNLVNHMRIHTGERPYKCPYCDRAFTQSGNLNNHIRLHTDEKPFKCHFCDKAFTQSGNLNSHIKNNHKDMTETNGFQFQQQQQVPFRKTL